MGKKKRTVAVRRIRFDLSKVLPPNDPFSISLIRLLMAVNDVRHIQKLLIEVDDRTALKDNFSLPIKSGEILHLFRLLSGHLYEAGIAFRSIDATLLDTAVSSGGAEEVARLTYLRQSFATEGPDALHYAYMKPLRDNLGFHYKMEPLKEALEYHVMQQDLEGVLIISEFSGLSRYSIADHLANAEIRQIIGVEMNEYPDAFQRRTGEVIKLVDALTHVVDLLLLHILEIRQGAILGIDDGKVGVSPRLSKAEKTAKHWDW